MCIRYSLHAVLDYPDEEIAEFRLEQLRAVLCGALDSLAGLRATFDLSLIHIWGRPAEAAPSSAAPEASMAVRCSSAGEPLVRENSRRVHQRSMAAAYRPDSRPKRSLSPSHQGSFSKSLANTARSWLRRSVPMGMDWRRTIRFLALMWTARYPMPAHWMTCSGRLGERCV